MSLCAPTGPPRIGVASADSGPSLFAFNGGLLSSLGWTWAQVSRLCTKHLVAPVWLLCVAPVWLAEQSQTHQCLGHRVILGLCQTTFGKTSLKGCAPVATAAPYTFVLPLSTSVVAVGGGALGASCLLPCSKQTLSTAKRAPVFVW